MFKELDFWEDTGRRSPAGHMAVDEALLLHAVRPTLRLYRWERPAATFGYSQRLEKIRQLAPDRPLVRRWTGGGLVLHGRDLTLAIVLPRTPDLAAASSQVIYDRIHFALVPVLAAVAGSARMAGAADRIDGPACFVSPAVGDVLAGGSKLLGGAIRRTKAGILYQGSIQCQALPGPDDVARALGKRLFRSEGTAEIERDAEILSAERYARQEWLELR